MKSLRKLAQENKRKSIKELQKIKIEMFGLKCQLCNCKIELNHKSESKISPLQESVRPHRKGGDATVQK